MLVHGSRRYTGLFRIVISSLIALREFQQKMRMCSLKPTTFYKPIDGTYVLHNAIVHSQRID